MSPGHRTVAAGVVRSGFLPDIVQPVSEVRSQAVGFSQLFDSSTPYDMMQHASLNEINRRGATK